MQIFLPQGFVQQGASQSPDLVRATGVHGLKKSFDQVDGHAKKKR